jgi:hypothetical protein
MLHGLWENVVDRHLVLFLVLETTIKVDWGVLLTESQISKILLVMLLSSFEYSLLRKG